MKEELKNGLLIVFAHDISDDKSLSKLCLYTANVFLYSWHQFYEPI